MKFNIYKESRENLKFALKIAGGTIIALLCLIVFLVFEVTTLSHRIEYVLIPPGIKKPLYIGNEAIDRDYLVAVGVYFAKLIEEYDPDTIDKNFSKALYFVASGFKSDFVSQFEKVKKEVIDNRIIQVFYISDISVEFYKTKQDISKELKGIVLSPVQGTIEISGKLIRKIGGSGNLWEKNVKVYIRYIVKYGMFQIVGFNLEIIKNKNKGED